MLLRYKGTNYRGRVAWIDADYDFEIDEWQIPNYRLLVETAESSIRRKLNKEEANIMLWLSSYEDSTIRNIINIISEAGKVGERAAKKYIT